MSPFSRFNHGCHIDDGFFADGFFAGFQPCQGVDGTGGSRCQDLVFHHIHQPHCLKAYPCHSAPPVMRSRPRDRAAIICRVVSSAGIRVMIMTNLSLLRGLCRAWSLLKLDGVQGKENTMRRPTMARLDKEAVRYGFACFRKGHITALPPKSWPN